MRALGIDWVRRGARSLVSVVLVGVVAAAVGCTAPAGTAPVGTAPVGTAPSGTAPWATAPAGTTAGSSVPSAASAVRAPSSAAGGQGAAVGVPGPRIPTTDLRPAPLGARTATVTVSAPVRITVASVGIDSSLVTLGLTPDGAVAPPEDPDTAGWFTGSTQPGQVGPAVIAGHVDSATGPAAFYRLADVIVGDDIGVGRQDGSQLSFRVTAIGQYPKDGFPTDEVYGPTPGSVIRLITCGGRFDRGSGHYRDNIVVYAAIV